MADWHTGVWLRNGICDLVERNGDLERVPFQPYVDELRRWRKEFNRVTEVDTDPYRDPVELQDVVDAARRLQPQPDADWQQSGATVNLHAPAPQRRPRAADGARLSQPLDITMKRCFNLLLLCLALVAGAALAQGIQRSAPKDVVLARMTVGATPQITLDGKPDRLSPGSRIRDVNNMLVLPGSIAGKTLPVVYRRDAAGLVHEVWQLTDDEYAKLGGTGSGADGARRFAELLALIFGSRR